MMPFSNRHGIYIDPDPRSYRSIPREEIEAFFDSWIVLQRWHLPLIGLTAFVLSTLVTSFIATLAWVSWAMLSLSCLGILLILPHRMRAWRRHQEAMRVLRAHFDDLRA